MSIEDMLQRICVQRPYFALEDLVTPEPGAAAATIPVQVPPAPGEAIGAAEAMRHGAILGLCAVASAAATTQHRYYLAISGTATWERTPSGPVQGTASGVWTSRRSCRARVKFSVGGASAMDMSVEYAVFTDAMFERIMSHLHRPDLDYTVPGVNPYTQGMVLDGLESYGERGRCTVTVTPEHCAGHFPGYPAAPVAMVLRAALDLAGAVAAEGAPWPLTEAHLRPVARLVRAGETISMDAEVVHRTPLGTVVRIDMSVDGEPLGAVTYRGAP